MSLRPRQALLPPQALEPAAASNEVLTWPKLEARLANMQQLIESNQLQLARLANMQVLIESNQQQLAFNQKQLADVAEVGQANQQQLASINAAIVSLAGTVRNLQGSPAVPLLPAEPPPPRL